MFSLNTKVQLFLVVIVAVGSSGKPSDADREVVHHIVYHTLKPKINLVDHYFTTPQPHDNLDWNYPDNAGDWNYPNNAGDWNHPDNDWNYYLTSTQ